MYLAMVNIQNFEVWIYLHDLQANLLCGWKYEHAKPTTMYVVHFFRIVDHGQMIYLIKKLHG